MLEKFARFNERLSGWIEWVGFFALFLMMALTCVNVVGGKIFRAPVYGALDVMGIAQLVGMAFATAMALVLGRHVQVEFFVMLLPKRLQAAIDIVINFLGLALFVFIVWRFFAYAYSLQTGGQESMTARIPLAPFTYAAAAAFIPVCLVFLQQFLSSIVKVIRNEP